MPDNSSRFAPWVDTLLRLAWLDKFLLSCWHILTFFLCRLFIAVVLISLVLLFCYYSIDTVTSVQGAAAFERIWLVSGLMLSLLITGLIYWHLLYRIFSHHCPSIPMCIIHLLFAAVLGLFIHYIYELYMTTADPIQLHRIAAIFSAIVLLVDYSFTRSSHFPLLRANWPFVRCFDWGIFLVTIAIICIYSILKHVMYDHVIAAGFVSGAITFQLIIANVMFDPNLYDLEFASSDTPVASTNSLVANL